MTISRNSKEIRKLYRIVRQNKAKTGTSAAVLGGLAAALAAAGAGALVVRRKMA